MDANILTYETVPPTEPCITSSEKLSENSTKIVQNFDEVSVNNGGKTGYYDLPVPSKEQILTILTNSYPSDSFSGSLPEYMADLIFNLLPNTLNDLIEYKNMPFWRGEILKATYGLEGRMEKNKDPQNAEIRELNKIIYYANRRLKMLEKKNA